MYLEVLKENEHLKRKNHYKKNLKRISSLIKKKKGNEYLKKKKGISL